RDAACSSARNSTPPARSARPLRFAAGCVGCGVRSGAHLDPRRQALLQRPLQRALALPPTEAAMLYAKAFTIGVVTAALAPLAVGVASLICFLVPLFVGGSGVTGPVGVSVNLQSFFLVESPGQLLMQMAVGFAIGFLFTLWLAMVKNEGRRSG